MTGPDRIWANPYYGMIGGSSGIWVVDNGGRGTEYVRRDPTVLAALPEVQALIRQAVETCVDEISDRADFVEDSIKWGGSKQYLTSLKGGLIELRNIAAAIRKRGEG